MELLYAEIDRGMLPGFYKGLDIEEDEYQLELSKEKADNILLNFSENVT